MGSCAETLKVPNLDEYIQVITFWIKRFLCGEAGKRTLSSVASHLARLGDPVERHPREGEDWIRELISLGELHLPATTYLPGRKWGGPLGEKEAA